MSFNGGYQSNTNLNDLYVVGDFPIDHSIGGFGIAQGLNDYTVITNTPVSQYRRGLLLELAFTQSNTGNVQVNVSGQGYRALKKPTPSGLVELEPGEINSTKIYLIVYDGSFFQLVNSLGGTGGTPVADASEELKGIAQIATNNDLNTGQNDSKFVTPLKLANYIAGKITGLWKDRGLMDCSTNPNYPAGTLGDAYTISGAGKIGGAGGQSVSARDVLYCKQTNAGGPEEATGSNWDILQANLEAASELIAGYVRLATTDELNAGESLVTAVSPKRLRDLLDGRISTETLAGLLQVATQTEVNAGLIDNKTVTPLKLSGVLKLSQLFVSGEGPGSVIAKAGANNVATGANALILSGQNNQASSGYSIAEGFYAAAALYNEHAKSGAAFYNVKGSSQCSVLNLSTIVLPGATGVVLTPDGLHAGENRWIVPANSVQQFKMQLSIVQNSGTLGAPGTAWTGVYEGAVRNRDGSVGWIGSAPVAKEVQQDPGFSPASGFNFTATEVVPYVNGITERNLHVSATVYITQTKFLLS